ncbi:hypothetical protein P3S68_020881 [Capsicum galapagoense]
MQAKDEFFFNCIDLGNTRRLRNVVCVRTHYKAVYRDFSDVIYFDTTYLMNQWCMPFASFIGVNFHNQSILLGCASIMSDDIETYIFLFKTWLAAMGETSLTTILTD